MPIFYDEETKTFALKEATEAETRVLIGMGVEFITYYISQNLTAAKLASGELTIEEVIGDQPETKEDQFTKMMKSFGKEIKH